MTETHKRVHADGASYQWVLCGIERKTAAFVARRSEFGRLATPPAPWCSYCAEQIEIAHAEAKFAMENS